MAKNTVLAGRASTTISSLIGNISPVIRNHFIAKFPQKYFKTSRILTASASNQILENSEGVYKIELPALIIKPDFDLSNESVFGLLPRQYNISGPISKNLRKNYDKVFFNETDQLYIYAMYDRVKLNFEFKIVVHSLMQQMDLLNYIKQMFIFDGHYYLNNIYLESEVPKLFINTILDEKGIDKTDSDEVIAFHDYLKIYSKNYIDVKKNLANDLDMYTFRYRANILCKAELPEKEDLGKKGMAEDGYSVIMKISTELWCPTGFLYESQKPIPSETSSISDEYVKDTIILNYTIKIEPPLTIADKTMILWQAYISDSNVSVDEVDLTSVMPNSIKKVIEYNNNSATPINNYDMFEVKVYYDDHELSRETNQFEFDWENLVLKTNEPLFGVTYHTGLWGNLKLINETLDLLGEPLVRF